MKPSPSRSAFSLMEILAVIAIAGILIALAIPALRSLGGNGANVGMTARNINGILQVAASEAKAKSMPIWVGFHNRVQGSDQQLIVATVTSSDGSGSLDAGAVPVGKPEIFNAIRLDTVAEYGGRATGAVQLAAANSDATFTLPVAGSEVTFAQTILRFSPSGEVTIPPNSDRVIEIGLQPMRGTTVAPGPNTAAIQITGLTGISRVYQP